jgi:acetyl/propionyl-CoA carboxylase alpha subunit/acetyl-CoA carboxylase carboxyltransferase component
MSGPGVDEELTVNYPAFRRLAVIGRAESAMRVINAVREWSSEGRAPLHTIAVHTAVDQRAMFVREADEAVLIGPADPADIGADPYLDHAELAGALRVTRAEAVWPDWELVADRPAFVELCERLGMLLVGPSGKVLRRLDEETESGQLARRLGLPMAPGGPAAGGARPVPAGRHIEVDVVADRTGAAWVLGARDCSVRWRGRVVIEESACAALDEEQRRLLRTAAAELVRAAGYRGAATIGFHLEPGQRSLSLLGVAPGPILHAVTEASTGVDLVKLQLHVAAGGTLDEIAAEAPVERGHAIQVRLTAQDPERGFIPTPGAIEHLVLPSGPGIRMDAGVAAGDTIPFRYDSTIATVTGWGMDRTEGRGRLYRALRRTAAVIDDGATNKAFLLDLLTRPAVCAGEADTGWLESVLAESYRPPRRLDVALLAAAVEAHDAHVQRQRDRLFSSAERGRPEVTDETWHQVDLRAAGQPYRLQVARTRPARYRVLLVGSGGEVDVDVERAGRFERRLNVDGQRFSVLAVAQGPNYLIEVDGAVHRISGGEVGLVRAPAPAMVVAVAVRAGDEVAEGDVLVVVESMKLETVLRAPLAGRVGEVLVPVNTQVEAGTKLVRIEFEPTGSAREGRTEETRADLSALRGVSGGAAAGTDPVATAADALHALRALVLGFDIDERAARPLLTELAAARGQLPDDHPGVLGGEIAVLRIFADLAALTRNRRMPERTADDGEAAVDVESARNPQEYLYAYLRTRDLDDEALPESFRIKLRRVLAHYGINDPQQAEPTPELGAALYRMFLAHRRANRLATVIHELLRWRLGHLDKLAEHGPEDYRAVLDHLVTATQLRHPGVGEVARQVRYRCFDAPVIAQERIRVQRQVRAELDNFAEDPTTRAAQVEAMVFSGEPILGVFAERHDPAMLEVMTRRFYHTRTLRNVRADLLNDRPMWYAEYDHDGHPYVVVATVASGSDADGAEELAANLHKFVGASPPGRTVLIDLYVTSDDTTGTDPDARAERIRDKLGDLPGAVGRVAVAVRRADGEQGTVRTWFTFRPGADGAPEEDATLRGLHPMAAERFGLWRLARFSLTRQPSAPDVHLFLAKGRTESEDRRLIVMADVRELTVLREGDQPGGAIRSIPQFERALDTCLDNLRAARAADQSLGRLEWNRVLLYVWPVVEVSLAEFDQVVRQLAPRAEGLGLEQALVYVRSAEAGQDESGQPKELTLRMSRPPGAGLTLRLTDPPTAPLRELDSYTKKVIKARRRGAVYPYELVTLLTRCPDPGGSPGTFVEYDLDESGEPVAIDRAPGGNTANLVLGVVTTPTRRYREGMTRVVLLGDPTKALGAIAEPECRRVLAALQLGRRLSAPVEWFAVSAGAKIAMDSGTENMDWISRVLRGLIEFTQDGGEINVVVTGINVGAQPYWNAEATMLMHTKGILVMTPDSTMVLTGKQSLDYSGGVSAEDNFGIGGYDRIMGPNGQAQYWAPDLSVAMDVLLAHYEHTYIAVGERFPRPAPSTDPVDRDIADSPHSGSGSDFTRLGQIFDPEVNAERKKPFDIRSLLRGVTDADHEPLERWADMLDAESVVVLDGHLGGASVALLGIESRPTPRRGRPPVDGPTQWTAGTLFPRSSKKAARAINAASGNRPLVVLANLSGFDGSPESLRGLQLEYGAEIGRAIVNFAGPIVFCVVSRYHGGAFVVFSGTLNDNMEIAAVEGSYASVIGGAPAAAVVFAGEVNKRTAADQRIVDLEARIAAATESRDDTELARLRGELTEVRAEVRAEKLSKVAEEFDTRHSIERAHQVGSVHTIVPAARLRPYLVDAVQRGMARTTDQEVAGPGRTESGALA